MVTRITTGMAQPQDLEYLKSNWGEINRRRWERYYACKEFPRVPIDETITIE